jgi:hypothetical protein
LLLRLIGLSAGAAGLLPGRYARRIFPQANLGGVDAHLAQDAALGG